jgi:hypothetical protein
MFHPIPMSTLKRMFLFLAMMILTGCSSLSVVDVYSQQELIDTPSLGSTNTSNLGEIVITKSIKYQRDAIYVNRPITFGRTWFSMQPQVLWARYQTAENIYFWGQDILADVITNEEYWTYGGGLVISKNNHHKPIGAWLATYDSKPTLEIIAIDSDVDIKFIKISDKEKPSFTQNLIYNGKSENKIKFLFKKTFNNKNTKTFAQKIEYDLSESNIIEFKGVIIEIIKATNRQIEYIVHRSFPDYE